VAWYAYLRTTLLNALSYAVASFIPIGLNVIQSVNRRAAFGGRIPFWYPLPLKA